MNGELIPEGAWMVAIFWTAWVDSGHSVAFRRRPAYVQVSRK
jgi:hypothetical protein